jgi:hypothetical protein
VDLRESLHAAAEEAPLATGSDVIDQAIARERRHSAARNAGIGGVALAAALATALAVPALIGGGQSTGTRTTGGPPTAASKAAPAPFQLTAADLAGLAAGHTVVRRQSSDGAIVYLYLTNGLAGRDIDPANPCTLKAGARPGVNGAPTPEDQCTQESANGVTVWVRRWGYSPQQRTWTTADSTIIDVFVPRSGGRLLVLTLSNTELPNGTVPPPTPGAQGPKFDLTWNELQSFVSILLEHRP